MMKKGMNWIGHCKDHTVRFGSEMYWGKDHGQQPGKDVVLDHIILDLTGKSVPLDHIEDASTKRAFKRKKRLLRHSNTVLISRLGIMALVTIMLVVTTLLTWYFTSTYSGRSVKSLARDLRQQLMRSSVQAMISVLGEVYNATVVLSSLHQQVYYGSSNNSWDSVELELRRVNRGVFNAQHQYSSVAFVSEDGRVTDYTRSRTAEYFFFVNTTYSQTNDTPVWYVQNLSDAQIQPPVVRHPPYPVSARSLLNYKPMQVYWTIATNLWNEAVVSPAVPAQDIITNDILGLATITSRFTYISQYLEAMDLLDGILYFQWNKYTVGPLLVAFSYDSSSDMLVSPLNASNPVVSAAALFLNSTYSQKILLVNDTHSENIKLVGQDYYIDTVPLSQYPYDALNLTAVMIVPRRSIMGRIDRRNHTVIRVSVGTAIGVLVLGCCFIFFLTSKMSTEMQLRQELIRLLVGKHRAEQSSNYKSQFLANMRLGKFLLTIPRTLGLPLSVSSANEILEGPEICTLLGDVQGFLRHELRTPIAAIIGLLELLNYDSLTPDQEANVSQIRSCATGLLALVNNVLDISRVEAGSMELDVAPFSVTEELESLVDMFAVQSVGSNIDVVLDLSDDIPPLVKGDAIRIRQIFSNLLSNSLKFTTQGHVLVRGWVDMSLLEQNKQPDTDFDVSTILSRRERLSGPLFIGAENQLALVFEVRDTGCGIPVELHETVFDSFVQADSSTTRTHGGSGLGLYIVRSLVELMGGEVAIVPIEGPGTLMRFHIILETADNPLSRASDSYDGHEAFSSPSQSDWLNSLRGSPSHPWEHTRRQLPEVPDKTQVLVAMQEGVAQKVAVQWLEKVGLKVTTANSWDGIIPVLEDVLRRNNSTELKSTKDVASDVPGIGIDPRIHNHFNISESTGRLMDNMTEFAKFPSVLALVDVTLHPSVKMGFDGKFVEPSFLDTSATNSIQPDPERLPPHMLDILNSMVRIHSQRPLAVGWIVAPDCGPRWKQALQSDGRFLVMKKPLSGSRMRQLLGLLSRTEKLEQHHWDAHSSQSTGSSSPSHRSTAIFNSEEGDFRSHAGLSREQSENNLGIPIYGSMPAFTAEASSDEEAMCRTTKKLLDDAGSQGSFLNDQQHSKGISAHGHAPFPDDQQNAKEIIPFRESSDHSVDCNEETVTQSYGEVSSKTALADFPANCREIRIDKTHSPSRGAGDLDLTPTTNWPPPSSTGVERSRKVLLVNIPYDTDESHIPFGSNVPQSPTKSPERATNGAMNSDREQSTANGVMKSDREQSTANGAQDIQRNGSESRDLDGESKRPVIDFLEKARQKQTTVAKESSTHDKNHFSHEKTVAAPRLGRLALPEIKTTSSYENSASIPDAGSAASNSAMAFRNRALSRMNILLVEDTPLLQRLASMMLKRLGANVTVVGDGQQAVIAVAEAVQVMQHADAPYLRCTPRFDLILMDCAMPVMDGYNATMAIRAAEENTSRHIPIVALTAHALPSDEERCLSVGMDAYLTKPIDCQRMVTTIQGLVLKGKG